MSRYALPIALLVGAALLALSRAPTNPPPAPSPAPGPVAPEPEPEPCPDGRCPLPRRPRPWYESIGLWEFGASVGGPVHADGTEIACDLPLSQHQKNTGGSDGAGLCVYASNRHTGRWQNCELFDRLFDWMRSHPGGSYPAKFDATVKQCAKELSLPTPDYLQVESNDLSILRAALRTGRMPGVTYSFSPTGRYGGRRISHMVSLVHLDDRWAVILDNNFPGTYEWMSPTEFQRTYSGGRTGWATILLQPGPPPPAPK